MCHWAQLCWCVAVWLRITRCCPQIAKSSSGIARDGAIPGAHGNANLAHKECIKFKASKVELGTSYTKCAGYEQHEIYSDDFFGLYTPSNESYLLYPCGGIYFFTWRVSPITWQEESSAWAHEVCLSVVGGRKRWQDIVLFMQVQRDIISKKGLQKSVWFPTKVIKTSKHIHQSLLGVPNFHKHSHRNWFSNMITP